MGLDCNGVRFLLCARARGVDFSRTAMIGRQRLNLTPNEFADICRACTIPFSDAIVEEVFRKFRHYSEEFLRRLGAGQIDAVDHSAYEGGALLHDMSLPIPEAWKGQYSLVLDGGTLEHVLNFPVAFRNCMEMVRPGGHFLAITPANNFMGHGFYQFSPELFFRLLTPTNGFHLELLVLFEDHAEGRWHHVHDPAKVGDRVTLINDVPVYIAFIARRVDVVLPLALEAQQSDYVAEWRRGAGPGQPQSSTSAARRAPRPWPLAMLLRCIPWWIKEGIKAGYARLRDALQSHTPFSPRFYVPFDWREDGRAAGAKVQFRE